MGMTPPLCCQFAGLTAAITCSDTAVAHILYHHFQHCLASPSSSLAHYHIQQTSTGWQLQRDQAILQMALNPLTLFEPLMQAALQCLITPQQQHLIFHAGGVAVAAQGILLCGPTGSGKSTLVAQLLADGFTYLSDEVVALPLDSLQLSGFARSLVLKVGSAFLWQAAPTSDDLLFLPDGLTWISPTFWGHDCVQQQATPQLLLFPRYEANSALMLRPLSPATAAFHLIQHLVNARNLPQHGLPVVKQLAQTIPAYEIHFGDGLAVAAWLRQQLAA